MTKQTKEKRHWYNFSFATPTGFCSSQTGYISKGVTMKRIRKSKEGIAGESAALLAVSYLGYMTEEDFTYDPSEEE